MEMASPSSSTSAEAEQNQPATDKENDKEKEKEDETEFYKTKTIQFLGRTTPIVLQNDNGPCPLLAICNILLLRNNLNLSPDIAEVSQEKLLSLVAERLIDSNSNVNNKDAGYVENQQQNIADAIDLLPRLATGIDVNIKFRRIDDFEFTRECAIFDLLDIPLYHGWIIDPQDFETAKATGSKSYNAITGELVALDTQAMNSETKNNAEEDSVDFVAATTATLGVPSPCLSKARSFDDSPRSVSDNQSFKKGDLEEEAELLMALKLSEDGSLVSTNDTLIANDNKGFVSAALDEHTISNETFSAESLDMVKTHIEIDHGASVMSNDHNDLISLETLPGDMPCSPSMTDLSNSLGTCPGEMGCSLSKTDQINFPDLSTYMESGEHSASNYITKICNAETSPDIMFHSGGENAISTDEDYSSISRGGEMIQSPSSSTNNIHEPTVFSSGHDQAEVIELFAPTPDSNSSSGRMHNLDVPDAFTSSVDGSEPIYEGEECILDSGTAIYEDREPMYEGEVILAEQADKNFRSNDEITPQQGELIRNFLKNNASQLTFYGLFCLQDGLKERELCVFFRNNHFSTMFKYDGELYLLATDQGYLNQPDLVWEKLNEVNGDTLFMTGNFKEFKVENHANDTWDESNAMANTADYIASIDNASQAGLDINSDLQLAIALQQQEFEQQQPQHSNVQQPISGSSRMVTGPQVPRSSGKSSSSSTSSSRTEAKSKEKCIVM